MPPSITVRALSPVAGGKEAARIDASRRTTDAQGTRMTTTMATTTTTAITNNLAARRPFARRRATPQRRPLLFIKRKRQRTLHPRGTQAGGLRLLL